MIDRRRFVGSLGAAALAGAVPGSFHAYLGRPHRPARHPAHVALLRQSGFPSIDGIAIDPAGLRAALDGLEVTYLDVEELVANLDPATFDVLVTPYGSAFPKPAWPQLHTYLSAGGNWLNLGGAPLAVPVRRDGAAWTPEVRQTAYHKSLGITQAFPVDVSGLRLEEANPAVPGTYPFSDGLHAETAWELYYRFTNEKEFPDEDGSDGPREATVEPLVSVFDAGEHPVAAPVVQIDRVRGAAAGGRWVLANFRGSMAPALIRALIEDAAAGVRRLGVHTHVACYHAGERPWISVSIERPDDIPQDDLRSRIEIFDERGHLVHAVTIEFPGPWFASSLMFRPGHNETVLPPGLYRVEATLSSDDPTIDGLQATTGFWIYDGELLAAGSAFGTDRDTLLRNGEPFVVTGTSYMASNVHRRFLLEPDPHVWDLDFAAMKRAGINMIRTGIWTGWERLSSADGTPTRSMLRALDAFMLTARRHDMPVIFTFFAFLPESWGGVNPYLDPRAVQAQKTFLSTIARRYRSMKDVLWDLINEPSFCSPERLWLTRPNYDRYEVEAWHDWLRRRYPSRNDAELKSKLAELWRTLPDDAMALPRPEEFSDRNIFEELRPLKATDYRLFANETFARWAEEMATTLRQAGSSDQLVTVGQDEGGTYERPSGWLHGPVVDFTSNHTWWLNDDLLWDHIVTKTPDRPNLISETGVMFYEEIDGSAWRSEERARNLLERKLVLAIVAGGAGFIEWIWNTNPYMPLDNEAAIGLLRPDGSRKPEFDAVRDIASFVAEHLHGLGPREPEPALMVIPHSYMFSVRNRATSATQRCVRAMSYGCRIAMDACSEYALDRLDRVPRLI
nr:glycoside hydrolase family 5 protein [Gemmatimonadota bacterium]NIR76349.1 glycoside hydrolase family 5 protein [Candidatus Kutchimonas denitrificans]NIS02370.1 glycoside hydrolase family 5 protein [Gemmatimonadota bacterium]NIT68192.1 glycoside hydrolase family 5 protein [Gemmatimonadota bacterium]NIU54421.1 cellulase family glycosylhydrolase [Gemmatimonadota bacterium]